MLRVFPDLKPPIWGDQPAGTGRYNSPKWTSTASMKPRQKNITWVSLTSVSPVVCLPGVSRSLDGFFVHAFTSASFPRKASNVSLDFYFLDFIVNNKSQVTNWTARHKAVALKLVQQAAVSSTKINQTQKTPKTNMVHLTIPCWKRRNIKPNHQFLGSNVNFWWYISLKAITYTYCPWNRKWLLEFPWYLDDFWL